MRKFKPGDRIRKIPGMTRAEANAFPDNPQMMSGDMEKLWNRDNLVYEGGRGDRNRCTLKGNGWIWDDRWFELAGPVYKEHFPNDLFEV